MPGRLPVCFILHSGAATGLFYSGTPFNLLLSPVKHEIPETVSESGISCFTEAGNAFTRRVALCVILYVAADNTAFGIADELYDFVAFFGSRQLRFDAVYGVGHVQARQIQVTVYFLYLTDLVV